MLKALLIILVFNFHVVLNSEAFGNNALNIPKIGAAFFDSPFSFNTKPWGVAYQWTMGTSFMQAINYRWWWLIDTNFALGSMSFGKSNYLSSFMGGAGVRYNFLQENFRPYASLMVHYVHFLGATAKNLPLDLGLPIFVGLKPALGFEFSIGSEIALLIEAAYGLYININEPFRQIYYINSCLAVYF